MACELVTAPDNKTQTVDLCLIVGSEERQHSPEGQLVEHHVWAGVFETWRSWRKENTTTQFGCFTLLTLTSNV
jgi:hypothetical protein